MVISGTTRDGFQFQVDDRAVNDFRFVKMSADLSQKKGTSEQFDILTRISEFILGSSWDALMEHIASKNDGFVPSKVLFDDVYEIINVLQGKSGDVKN